VLPIPLAGDERHMYGSIDIKCKTRTRNAVSVAALQERLGYLAIILGLVGFKKVSGEETKRALFPSNCPQSR
jgi:hypothetical protein